MDRLQILENMKQIYAECKTFREISRVPSSRAEATKGRLDADLEFRVWFRRPSSYRVEAKFLCIDAHAESATRQNLSDSRASVDSQGSTEATSSESSKGVAGSNKFMERNLQAALEYEHFLLVGDETKGVLIQYAGQFDRSAGRKKIQTFPNGRAAIGEQKSAVRTLQLFEETPYYLDDIKGTTSFPDQMVGENMCHHIVVYSSPAFVETHLWVDMETFLLRKIHQPVPAMLKPALSLLRFAPFKLGDFLASDIQGDELNMHTEYIVHEAELNPEIDPFVFELPPDA
jgi:hypothetical protein